MATEISKTDGAVLRFLEDWLVLLSEGRFDHAANALSLREIPMREYGFRHLLTRLGLRPPPKPFVWTGDFIRSSLFKYRPDARVTLPSETLGPAFLEPLRNSLLDEEIFGSVHPEFPLAVFWFRDPPENSPDLLGYAHFSYPLNGKWSDLSSEFHLMAKGENVVIELERIEVM